MNHSRQLFLLSFLMFFIELMLIRWSTANILYLTNVSNYILLASFLGIGLGFLRKKGELHLFQISPILLCLFMFACYHFSYNYQVKVNPMTDNILFTDVFFKSHVFPEWFSLPMIFTAVAMIMMCMADEISRLFGFFPSLTAYRLETLGSLAGIIVFSLLSFYLPSPIYWGIVVGGIYSLLMLPNWLRINHHWRTALIAFFQISALIILVITLSFESFSKDLYWSTYYKIQTQRYTGDRYAINVNGFPQQIIESVKQRERVKPFYTLPYRFRKTITPLNNVLVVGAGTGGDVAIALAQGAKHVDAVEIDPILYRLGKELNPNHPYSDSRVSVYINDGRAFLQQSKQKYDMIIFALTDSLMVLTGQSSLRQENYLYTMEAFETVKQHLTADGIFTIYNFYGLNWVAQRLANTLSVVFNHSPCLSIFTPHDYNATVLAISPDRNALTCPYLWQSDNESRYLPVNDNKPFFYLQDKFLPINYSMTLLFVLLISLMAIGLTTTSTTAIIKHVEYFLMGVAFLLLETKNIVNYALLFGTTWIVNALVFSGIIFIVYLAIETTHRIKIKSPLPLFFALLLSLLIAWLTPIQSLLLLPASLRFILATILAFSPIYLANLIFASFFAETNNSSLAFGANLIGAVIGGLLEYSSLLIGYDNLLLVAFCVYLLAMTGFLFKRTQTAI